MSRFGRGPALPAFPWDAVAGLAETADAHPGGRIDLSIGAPVDPTPQIVRDALAAASDAPTYPYTIGTPALRAAIDGYLRRVCGATADTIGILPTIGSKELIATLPGHLGIGLSDLVAIPELAYPTYEVGTLLAGAIPLRYGTLADIEPSRPAIIWVNSPANPHGAIVGPAELAELLAWGRANDALVISDECYLEFGWDAEPVSILNPAINGGSLAGLLAVHSLSKRSNMGGYRAGTISGDPDVIAALTLVRKHAGFLVPLPVQAAMVAALGDDEHVREQRERYAARRSALRTAVEAAGLTVSESAGGIYLWVRGDGDAWQTAAWFAERGILVAPGTFYGKAGAAHVRVALTATDAAIGGAVVRLAGV